MKDFRLAGSQVLHLERHWIMGSSDMHLENKVLRDKVAIVTGGGRGLGSAIAMALSEARARVLVTSRTLSQSEETAILIRRAGGEAKALSTDVTKIADIKIMVADVIETYGRIDILVNNAGTAITKQALEISEEEWDRVLDTNLKSVFFCSQQVAKQMVIQGKGKIVNISSVMASVGDVSISPYCASKGGVAQLTKALALEWARHNINVNAVGRAYVRTELNDRELADEKVLNYVLRKTPLKRLGTKAEVASAVLYLASEAADYITGQTIYMDGGWLAE